MIATTKTHTILDKEFNKGQSVNDLEYICIEELRKNTKNEILDILINLEKKYILSAVREETNEIIFKDLKYYAENLMYEVEKEKKRWHKKEAERWQLEKENEALRAEIESLSKKVA